MKKTAILAFLTFGLNSYSQNIEIAYSVSENTADPILATKITYNLILNEHQSVYFNNNDSIKQFKYQHLIQNVDKIGELTQVRLSDNHLAYIKQDFFYKDYVTDTLIYNEIILGKKIFVGEKIRILDWEMIPKSDTIVLGFKCQKAKTKFRGRTYEALFSSELGLFGGPWKFDGLPGVILSVKSLDNYFVIEPLKVVKNSKSNHQIKNIYATEKVVSWNLFKVTYENKLKEQLKKLKSLSEDGEGGSIKITDKIEDLELPEMRF